MMQMKPIVRMRRAAAVAGLAGALLCAATGGAFAQQTAKDPLLVHGEDIARRQCAACHIVAPDQQSAPILKQPTPSFSDIANRPTTSTDSLRKFLAKTHWDMQTIPMRMPEPLLTQEQVAAVSRYILSLREP